MSKTGQTPSINTATRKPFRTALLFLWQWIKVSIVGWLRIAFRMVRFHLLVVKSISPVVHGFIISSLAVGILPVFGWFRYSISLGETETFEVTTDLWYVFFLPGATALLLILHPVKKAFSIQVALSSFIAVLFLFAIFFPDGLHYSLRIRPEPTVFYYGYAIALALHLALCVVLKKPENGILNRMRIQWKTEMS
jgi:hypothetical protein